MTIRPERPDEYDAIYELIRVAFQTAQRSDGTEQDYANALRAGKGYIPELALVAEQDGELIGHVMFTRVQVKDGAQSHDILLVAPVSVVLAHRGQGVGSALMRHGLRRAKEMGFGAAFLLGNPAYYGRFGFVTSSGFGIRYVHDVPAENVMVCELYPGALAGVHGVVDC